MEASSSLLVSAHVDYVIPDLDPDNGFSQITGILGIKGRSTPDESALDVLTFFITSPLPSL